MKQLEIELKTGENLILEVTPLFLEYVQDYEGGIEQLQRDSKSLDESKNMYVANQLLYAIIASNYHKGLTYGEAVRLVKIEDMEKIINFINEELPNAQENFIPRMRETRHRM